MRFNNSARVGRTLLSDAVDLGFDVHAWVVYQLIITWKHIRTLQSDKCVRPHT